MQCLRGGLHRCEKMESAGADKYDETAVAMIALLKYGTGVPFNRLEGLQRTSGDAAAGDDAVGPDGCRRRNCFGRCWWS